MPSSRLSSSNRSKHPPRAGGLESSLLGMKRAKKISALVLATACLLFSTGLAYADTKPYFKGFGADVFAGGWFNSGATSCSSSDAATYQAPTFNPSQNLERGGILAYANGRIGSSSDFGAFAMGLIQGDATNSYGFYTGQTASINTLSFANANTGISANYWGGFLAGPVQQIHCIPDYFGTKQKTPALTPGGTSFNVGSLQSGQYLAPSNATSDISATGGPDATITAGKDVTVFIEGNAYISHNIVYAGSYTSDNVPKFALVVKGNIYIAPGVSRVDGVYIAQPTTNVASGSLWTCHDNSNTNPSGYWVFGNCSSPLTINGAIMARQVNLMRINGDIGDNNSNPAEVINYTPAMVIGGSFFNIPPSSDPKIDSLISLPPVF